MTKLSKPGIPKRVTKDKDIMLIGKNISTEVKIRFKPYNITKAIHNFFTNFIIFFAIFITVKYMT